MVNMCLRGGLYKIYRCIYMRVSFSLFVFVFFFVCLGVVLFVCA